MAIGAYGDKGSKRGSKSENNATLSRYSGYTPSQYNNRFRGVTQNPGFRPVKTFTNEGKIKEQNRQILADMKEQEKAARRQSKLDQDDLDRSQRIERLELDNAFKVQNAERKARNELYEGIGKLSKTALDGMNLWAERKQEQEEFDNAITGIFGDTTGGVLTSDDANANLASPEPTQLEQDTAVVGGATEQVISEDVESPVVAESIRQPTSDAPVVMQATNSNVIGVVNGAYPYVQDRMRGSDQIQLPDGRVVSLNQINNATDASYAVRVLLSEYAQETGLLSLPRGVLEPHLGTLQNQATNLTNNFSNIATDRGVGDRQTQAEDNLNIRLGQIPNNLSEDELVPLLQSIYNTGTNTYRGTGAERTNGFGRANGAVFEDILAWARANERYDVIDAIARVQSNPNQAGTEFGNTRSGDIDAARRGLDTRVIQDSRNEAALQGIEADDIEDRMNEELAQSTSNEEDREIRTRYAEEAALLGSDDGDKLADRIILTEGLSYNPETARELRARRASGEVLSQELLASFLRNGDITEDEAKALGYNINGTGHLSDDEEALNFVTENAENITNGVEGLIADQLRAVGSQSEINAIIDSQGQGVVSRMSERVRVRWFNWRLNNRDASDADASTELTRILQDEGKRINWDSGTRHLTFDGGSFGATASDFQSLPVYENPNTGMEYREVSNLSIESIRNNGNSIAISNDQVLTSQELDDAYEIGLAGNNQSPRVNNVAAALGVTPDVLIRMQGQAYGRPDIANWDGQAIRREAHFSAPSGEGPESMVSGAKVLHEVWGFPTRSSAMLSANIQQESAWDGQRSWDIGHIDGTDRNGGLVSWQNTASTNHWRLRDIEAYLQRTFGVSDISQATHSQQLDAMVWEMKNKYPQAYRTFMNPNATDRELRGASYQYWGWGHEGDRFTTFYPQALAAFR